MTSAINKSDDRPCARVKRWTVWMLKLLFLFFVLPVQAQFLDAGGPFIDDALPWGYRAGGGGQIVGPQFPGFGRRTSFAPNNVLRSITSGSATFDNGSIFASGLFDSGLNPGISIRSQLQNGLFSSSWNEGFKVALGPLLFSDFIGGIGAFYTDFNTPTGIGDESGWSSVLTLSTRVELTLPYLSLGGNISGYYLPFEDKWGYGTPSPIIGLLGQLGFADPGTAFIVGTKGNILGWDFIIYDQFVGEALMADLTEYFFDEPATAMGQGFSLGSASAALPFASASDRVGRYQFGGAFVDRDASVNESFQSPRFANRAGAGFFNQDRMWFTNTAGAVIGRLLTPTVRNLYWFRRDDYWATSSFNSFGNFMTGGAYLDSYGSVYAHPFAGYEFGTFNDFETIHHTIKTGSWGSLTPTISYITSLGWLWTSGLPNDTSTAMYDLVLNQSIGSRLQHYLGAGRTLSDPTFGERYIMDYVMYGISYSFSPHTILQAVAGTSNVNGSLSGSTNAEEYHAGIRLRKTIGNSFLSLSAINEHYDFNATGQEIDQWVYKALYSLPFRGPRTTAYTGYQYIDRRSNSSAADFTEHLLLFYVTQRF